MISDADPNAGPSHTTPSSSRGAEHAGSGGPGNTAPAARPDGDALFLDVDGTLLHIASHPDAVRVSGELVALLERTAERFDGALALISGRSIDNLDALFAPLQLPCAGVHGLERRGADTVVHRGEAEALLAPLRAPLEAFVLAHQGLLLEDKGQSLALHFRNAPQRGPDAADFLQVLIAAAAPSLELKRGKMVLEVKPGNADKGTAIAAFLREPPFAGRRPVFVGDDVTDEDGFAVANRLGGLSLRVGPPAQSLAVHRLADEEAVYAWLRRSLTEPQDREV